MLAAAYTAESTPSVPQVRPLSLKAFSARVLSSEPRVKVELLPTMTRALEMELVATSVPSAISSPFTQTGSRKSVPWCISMLLALISPAESESPTFRTALKLFP